MIASACLAWLAIGLVVFATDIHESDEPLTPRGVTDDLVVYCVLGPIIVVGFVVIEGCRKASYLIPPLSSALARNSRSS